MPLTNEGQQLLYSLVTNQPSVTNTGVKIYQPFPGASGHGKSFERHKQWVLNTLLTGTVANLIQELKTLQSSQHGNAKFDDCDLEILEQVATGLGMHFMKETYKNISKQADHESPRAQHDY